jgi:hypothetical protein
MKYFVASLFIVISFTICASETVPVKVGTYDSRAVAIAYAGSSFCQKYLAGLHKRHKAAKAAGDKKEMSKVEAEAKTHQKQLHMQGFSTAPVDKLLSHIKEQLPDIKKKAAVDIIVSKWDKKSLDKYKSSEKKDITMLLVTAYRPNARTIKIVKQIQARKPIPLKQVENIKD